MTQTADIDAAPHAIGTGLYDVIYADPPWRFKPMFKGAVYENDQEVHYPTMGLDDICTLPVPAAKSAVLFLWVTSPHLEQGLRVIRDWGFAYKSSAVWVKPWPRTGYWWRNQHELLLVANRGKWPAPKPRERAASLYEFPTTRHSEKPAVVRDQIAGWWPDARRLEMFARTSADGWDSWGNEDVAA
jgi:N6-adenosine-specific RNA methylase IME4